MKSKKLKIFLVMSGSATAIHDSEIMYRNVLDSLLSLGHEISHFDFGTAWNNINESSKEIKKEILTKDIINKFNEEDGYDLFLSFLADLYVVPDLYKEIKKNCPTVNWTCNSHQFDDLHKEISPFVDLNTYISLDHKELYDSVNANSYWMPMAANPNFYKNNKEKDINLSFIGSAYGKRPYYLWRLLQSEIDIDVYGFGWKFENNIGNFARLYILPLLIPFFKDNNKIHHIEAFTRINILKLLNNYYQIGGPLNDVQYADTLSRSKITLNFPESRVDHNYMNPKVIRGVNFRDFEAPMSGAMLMTQFSNELEFFYKDSIEVISFHNEHDLIDKCKFYKKNDSARIKIAEAGFKRANNEHTWEARFNKLFNDLDDLFNIYS